MPTCFERVVSNLTLPATLFLTDKSKRLWPVTLEDLGGSGSSVYFTDGWKNFATAIGLQCGDMLTFDRLDAYEWKVTLYDNLYVEREVPKLAGGQPSTPSSAGSFGGVVVGYSPERDMQVWVCVDGNHLLRDRDSMRLQTSASDRVYNVKFSFGEHYMVMGYGWIDFEFENEIAKRDRLIFQPTDNGTTFMVTVFTEQGMERRVTLGPLTLQTRRLNFQKHMKKHMTYSLDISVDWIRATGLQPPLSVVLQNTQGRQWQVGVERRRNNYGFHYKFESAAWHAFYVANGLRDGDLVEFQYLSAVGNHWSNMMIDVHLLFCLGSDSARIYGFAAKDVIVKPTNASVSQQPRPGFGPVNLSKTLPSINTSSRHIDFAEKPKVDKDITTTLFKIMSYCERLPIEEEYNWIQGTRDEIRLLRLVRDGAIAGAMEDVVTATMGIMRIAKIMMNILRSLIRPVDVACKIEEIRRRLEDFIWFISFPEIHFDAQTNTVYVSPAYWNRYEALHMEPHRYIGYRLVGEPNYTLLREVFMEGRVGTLDMQWIISTLDGLGDPEWIRMPLKHWWWVQLVFSTVLHEIYSISLPNLLDDFLGLYSF
ncbi:hypothetical protein C2S52_012691 [Perilla frutescens var. hirtella]|nr:hypothetical protein C2S52_012691 [Perilla frutescens var. hirtella]